MKVYELANEWLYIYHKDDIKPRTLLRYESLLRFHIIPLLGEEEIDNLKPRDIQLWIAKLKQCKNNRKEQLLSPSSINSMIAVLKMMFNYALDFEIITNNPISRIKMLPKRNIENNKAFTREEQIKIENYIERINNDEYFPYILTLYTGLRLGELCALLWKDINLKSSTISINKTVYRLPNEDNKWVYKIDTPKSSNSNRDIPIPTFLRNKLAELKKTKKSIYFMTKNDGSRLDDKLLVARYKSLLKKAKVRYLSFHSLRHTFATRALESGIDIKTLSEILGHSNVSTTLNIYTHSLIKHKKQQIKKIKRLI